MVRFISIIALVVAADQISKLWIVRAFSLHESLEVIPGFFNLTYLTNNGAAFSMLAGQPALWRQVFFISAAIVALIIICIAQRSFHRESKLYTVAFAFIAGGAIGNLIDRIRLGHVTDFLDVYLGTYHWPAFNVADAAITVGVSMFFIVNIAIERKKKKEPQEA